MERVERVERHELERYRMTEHPLAAAFFVDGALRDVYADGTRAELEAFARRLAENGWELRAGGETLSLDELARAEPPGDAAWCVSATRSGCQLNLWCWSPRFADGFFSEADLSPREVDAANVEGVAEALTALAEVLGREVRLVMEGAAQDVLAVARPDGTLDVDEQECASLHASLISTS